MAWVLITGEDIDFLRDALPALRPAGYKVVAVPEGATALQLLVDSPHHMVVLLLRRMGQMDVADFLSAVADDDTLRWNHAYILVDEHPSDLPVDVEHSLDALAAPVVETPVGASDVDGWADLLDAISLAVRSLPSERGATTS